MIDKDDVILKGDIKIIVETVRVGGRGVILLTGPSSCGKGEVAKSLQKFLSIPESKHLSMGAILRVTIDNAKNNIQFREKLSREYGISHEISIFDGGKNRHEVYAKAQSYRREMEIFFGSSGDITQLEWLEFCVKRGLLVPDEWTDRIIEALFEDSPSLKEGILILDGYPRTIAAAESLLKTFTKLKIPIIRVLHLSITKEQMKIRAMGRKRTDDTEESLERRYQFYIDKVQPCIDYLKYRLGSAAVALIDAHQPVYYPNGELNIEASIHEVTLSVMQALGLPGFLLDID